MRLEEAYVLVIEDDINNQQIITDLLELMGIKHIYAHGSGWQGLKAARERMQSIDLILLDIQLPAEDGYGVLRRIRESPRFRNTRVVAVTSNVHTQDEARAPTALSASHWISTASRRRSRRYFRARPSGYGTSRQHRKLANSSAPPDRLLPARAAPTHTAVAWPPPTPRARF